MNSFTAPPSEHIAAEVADSLESPVSRLRLFTPLLYGPVSGAASSPSGLPLLAHLKQALWSIFGHERPSCCHRRLGLSWRSSWALCGLLFSSPSSAAGHVAGERRGSQVLSMAGRKGAQGGNDGLIVMFKGDWCNSIRSYVYGGGTEVSWSGYNAGQRQFWSGVFVTLRLTSMLNAQRPTS